jgi:hypothetical protein
VFKNQTIKLINMSTVLNVIAHPITSLKRKFAKRNMVILGDTTPPARVVPECKYGEYCIKSEVIATDSTGEVDRTFIGYSGDMNITIKTKYVCERLKNRNTTCGDPSMVIRGGDCKEVIFVKDRAGIIREISSI